MTISDASEYYVCMNMIKARERIDANTVSTWPHMKKEDRSRLYNKLLKEADMIETKHRAATAQDIARIIGK